MVGSATVRQEASAVVLYVGNADADMDVENAGVGVVGVGAADGPWGWEVRKQCLLSANEDPAPVVQKLLVSAR